MIKVLTREQMRAARKASCEQAKLMTVEQITAQMRRNGSRPTPNPNPWYIPQKDESNFQLLP